MTKPHPIVSALREIRIERRLSQTTLAGNIGVGQNVLAYRELGHCSPQLNSLTDWADALGFDIVLRPKE